MEHRFMSSRLRVTRWFLGRRITVVVVLAIALALGLAGAALAFTDTSGSP